MAAIATWTGKEADALREAFRMTNEAFAEYLGVSIRTVAYWRKRPKMVPRPAMQETLDAALDNAPDRVKAQFSVVLAQKERQPAKEFVGSGLWLANGANPDEVDRLEAIRDRPPRLDATAVNSLTQVLASQRHLEDAMGASVVLPSGIAQMDVLTKLLREASGPHRDALANIVAEWTSFVGWLHTAVGQEDEALNLFKRAEDMADEVENGTIAATATSFRGHIARLQGRSRSVIRASAAALGTPGAHQTQRIFDMLQSAHGYADLGDKEQARVFLSKAADLAGDAGEPPPSVYWYTEPFFRLNIGLAQLGIGEYREAAESLRSGLRDLPEDQRNAEWLHEYRQGLAYAADRS